MEIPPVTIIMSQLLHEGCVASLPCSVIVCSSWTNISPVSLPQILFPGRFFFLLRPLVIFLSCQFQLGSLYVQPLPPHAIYGVVIWCLMWIAVSHPHRALSCWWRSTLRTFTQGLLAPTTRYRWWLLKTCPVNVCVWLSFGILFVVFSEWFIK